MNLFVCSKFRSMEIALVAGGIIPSGGIQYLQEYNFFEWGDIVFLSMMDFAIAFVLVGQWSLPAWIVALCFLLGIAWTAVSHWIWLQPRHIPDSFYPYSGVVSPLGRMHLVYFGAQYILGFMGIGMIVLMVRGERPWSIDASAGIVVGLAAALAYFITLLSDIRAGRARLL